MSLFWNQDPKKKHRQPKPKVRACPKCQSKKLFWVELWGNASIQFEQDPETGLVEGEGLMEPGDPTGVQGNCRECGHNWTVRGCHQIDQAVTRVKYDGTLYTDIS